MGVWCWCFGDAVSPVYVHCGTLLNPATSAVYAGESSTVGTDSTREGTLILSAEAM